MAKRLQQKLKKSINRLFYSIQQMHSVTATKNNLNKVTPVIKGTTKRYKGTKFDYQKHLRKHQKAS